MVYVARAGWPEVFSRPRTCEHRQGDPQPGPARSEAGEAPNTVCLKNSGVFALADVTLRQRPPLRCFLWGKCSQIKCDFPWTGNA